MVFQKFFCPKSIFLDNLSTKLMVVGYKLCQRSLITAKLPSVKDGYFSIYFSVLSTEFYVLGKFVNQW
jgi:hypothetical protein